MEHRFEMVSLKNQKQSCEGMTTLQFLLVSGSSEWLVTCLWKQAPQGDSWCPGCSGLESLGDELREQWGAAGSRLLATDLVRIEAGQGGWSFRGSCRLLGWLRQHLLPPPSRLRWGRRSSSGNTQECNGETYGRERAGRITLAGVWWRGEHREERRDWSETRIEEKVQLDSFWDQFRATFS